MKRVGIGLTLNSSFLKALLSRRKTEQEKREEKRIHDEKVLEEYRAQKIRQARVR